MAKNTQKQPEEKPELEFLTFAIRNRFKKESIGFVAIREDFVGTFPHTALAPGMRESLDGEAQLVEFGLVPCEEFLKAYQ